MLTREEAFDLVMKNVTKKNIKYHMIAVEAIMKHVAKHICENQKLWALTGLLHDIDYEKTVESPQNHSLLSEELLGSFEVPKEVIRAIKAHNFQFSKVKPLSIMEKALVASDAISGLLIACALVMPSKRLAEVTIDSVTKKFKDKSFARSVSRERILFCEDFGLSKKQFFKIALDGLKTVSSEINL
jgi:putative nucleotidyltransferase with HDIG domain